MLQILLLHEHGDVDAKFPRSGRDLQGTHLAAWLRDLGKVSIEVVARLVLIVQLVPILDVLVLVLGTTHVGDNLGMHSLAIEPLASPNRVHVECKCLQQAISISLDRCTGHAFWNGASGHLFALALGVLRGPGGWTHSPS
jgi:hypothetical protein